MDQLQRALSCNLKRMREERGMSLDQMAKLCGVSKSMLSQMERGSTSPTISTVWKISNGLKIPFTELVSHPEGVVERVERAQIEPLTACDGLYRNYPLFHFAQDQRFEVYLIELDPGALLSAEPHPNGSQEFILVFAGELQLDVVENRHCIQAGNAIRFAADQPHTYRNDSDALCQMHMVISYP